MIADLAHLSWSQAALLLLLYLGCAVAGGLANVAWQARKRKNRRV